MDVMRGLEERGNDSTLTGVENLMLHFTPHAEDWSKLPVIVSGEGCYVTDDKGRSYVDGLAGLFTTQVGNGRTEIAEAAAGQMKDLGFFPNWSFQHPKSLELAEKLAQIAPGDLDTSFFVSSGSEAVETAIKLARQYHKANGDAERYKVISRKVAYHGTTLGALSATGLPAFKAPFEPLLQGFAHVANTHQDPEGAADAIEEAIDFGPPETVAAVILEPVQNGGGCLVPPEGYWPMGGLVAGPRITETMRENVSMFMHGSTFGGHPVSAAVALENIKIMEREKLLDNVHALEGHFGDELKRMAAEHSLVREVRGMGFFWGVEIRAEWPDGTPITGQDYQKYFKGVLPKSLLKNGLICRFDDKEDPVIQYAPALIADREVLSRIAEITDQALSELEHEINHRRNRG